MRKRLDPWPSVSDLFSGLLVASFAGLIIFTAAQPTDVKALRAQVRELQSRLAPLGKADEWWKKNFNEPPPASCDDLVTVLRKPETKALCAELGRGHPRCEKNEKDNVLIRATVRRGATSIEVLTSSPRLNEWLKGADVPIPAVGTVLTDKDTIQSFLDAVTAFYRAQPAKQSCRFDYSLTYETKEDFHDGVKGFDNYFYPAGRQQVPNRSP